MGHGFSSKNREKYLIGILANNYSRNTFNLLKEELYKKENSHTALKLNALDSQTGPQSTLSYSLFSIEFYQVKIQKQRHHNDILTD